MDTMQAESCCLVNVHAYKCIALGVPIFIRGSPKSYENGDPGVPKILWKWGPRVPNLGGPYFHMTPVSICSQICVIGDVRV